MRCELSPTTSSNITYCCRRWRTIRGVIFHPPAPCLLGGLKFIAVDYFPMKRKTREGSAFERFGASVSTASLSTRSRSKRERARESEKISEEGETGQKPKRDVERWPVGPSWGSRRTCAHVCFWNQNSSSAPWFPVPGCAAWPYWGRDSNERQENQQSHHAHAAEQ